MNQHFVLSENIKSFDLNNILKKKFYFKYDIGGAKIGKSHKLKTEITLILLFDFI